MSQWLESIEGTLLVDRGLLVGGGGLVSMRVDEVKVGARWPSRPAK
jgi:hypothetical protein